MNPLIKRALNNKHTTIAMLVYLVFAELIPQLGAIWCPHLQQQFDSTARVIKDLAVGYGFLMAGDSSTDNPQQGNK